MVGQMRRKRRPDPTVPRTVAVGETRTHLEGLRAAGVGTRRIAELAAVERRTILDILDGRRKHIRPETRDRLMAVMPTALAPGTLVDAGPTLERVEQLVAAGWTRADLGRLVHGGRRRQLELPSSATYRVVLGCPGALFVATRPTQVTRRTARIIAELAADVLADPQPEPAPAVDPIGDWTLPDMDRSWRAQAACRFRPPGEEVRVTVRRFFVDRGGNIDPAKALCARCDVREPCLAFAIATGAQGVWGGLTERERRPSALRTARMGGVTPQH